MPPLFRMLHQLDPSDVNQAVKLRLIRCYPLHVGDDTNNVYSLECVLRDAEGARIHASIKKAFIPRFQNMLREGNIYAIKNFVMANNTMKIKTTKFAFKMVFIPKTNVSQIFDADFPRNVFDFKAYDDLSLWENLDEDFLIETGKMFFVYGYGESGKTYIWRTLSARLRSQGFIVLNVASSGIASLLLPGGRTAHSRFAIPFNLTEDSVCNNSQGSPLAELLIKAHLIIWDEAPMVNKHCFEALDRSMRDIMRVVDYKRNEFPFGGKSIVFGGDFRQILPVIPKGSRQDIVHATINSSYLWKHCVVLRLTKNMRLQGLDSSVNSDKLRQFANWIARVGDGKINEPNDGIIPIKIPKEFLLERFDDPIIAMVENIYSEYLSGRNDLSYFEERAILAPTLDVVNAVNEYMISLNVAEGRTYLSSDVACHTDQSSESSNVLHTPEFINSISISGLPDHKLNLKVGTPVMLIRNLDSSLGLCNGTHLIITRLGNHVLEGEVISSGDIGRKVLISRMSLTPSDTKVPFRFERRQFPLMISYAMTINKSQGQSLAVVGLILKRPVFCHGQLYVALSRVKSPDGLKILICNNDNPGESDVCTDNVVYKEVFHNV